MVRKTAIDHFKEFEDDRFRVYRLWMTVLTMVLIVAITVICGFWPSIVPGHATAVGGLVTCLGLFLGGSVTAQHLTGKNMNAALQTDAEATASFEAGPAKQNVSTSLPPPGQPPEPAQKPVEPRQF